MQPVRSGDSEDKLVYLWKQYECLYQVTAFTSSNPSALGSRRELVANSCTHRRRDATRQFRRVGFVVMLVV